MSEIKNNKLTRIAVFYDGNYFFHVSSFYNYVHDRKSRISIGGLHEFIRHKVAAEEGSEFNLCTIVDAHYFKGRISAKDANQKPDRLYYERVFEEVLVAERVTTHYIPVRGHQAGKGTEMILALEAFEHATYHKFDVLVLIACDGDYAPLVKKLNTFGIKVMLLGWDFEFEEEDGNWRQTKTSQELLEAVNIPVLMNEIIDDPANENEAVINNIFVKFREKNIRAVSREWENFQPEELNNGERFTSTIQAVKDGFGFIIHNPENLFFHFSALINTEFNDLNVGDDVEFSLGLNPKGQTIATAVKLV
ncbi:MAG: NYN domain-containing protein [Bacteroidetes bacterium]|nr:NYN domain-containing protein [Bacteroidota bacterium]